MAAIVSGRAVAAFGNGCYLVWRTKACVYTGLLPDIYERKVILVRGILPFEIVLHKQGVRISSFMHGMPEQTTAFRDLVKHGLPAALRRYYYRSYPEIDHRAVCTSSPFYLHPRRRGNFYETTSSGRCFSLLVLGVTDACNHAHLRNILYNTSE